MSSYPYKNLVFRGGGILGIAYLGSLQVLDEKGILPQIKRVAGASAGAITALVVSMCTTSAEMKEIADSLDFKEVPDKSEGKFQEMVDKTNIAPAEDAFCVSRLFKNFGWYTTDFFYRWLKDTIQTKFDEKKGRLHKDITSKKGLQTFADFRAAGYRDVYVSVTNVTKMRNEIFSIETTPDLPLADAVRMSMSIPLYFESVEYNGDHYADGGTVNNYPMEVFDNEKYNDGTTPFVDGINRETLGCHLFTSEASKAKKEKAKKHDTLIHYIENLFLTLMQVQKINYAKTPNIQERSAEIDDLGISATNFDIEAQEGDLLQKPYSDTPYGNLYRSGYLGMEAYLK